MSGDSVIHLALASELDISDRSQNGEAVRNGEVLEK